MKQVMQSVQWHITEVCSNRCKHCYINSSSNKERQNQEMGFKELIHILDNFAAFEKKYNANIDTYALTGGDPFAHKDFERLLRELHNRKKNIRILGIPERITKDNIRMLESYGVLSYQVSLDGLKETHDAIRGKGSFDRTILAVKRLNESNIIANIMFTVHNQNCHELMPLIDYLDAQDLKIIFGFDFLVMEGEAKDNFAVFTAEQVNELLEEYLEKKESLHKRNRKIELKEKSKLFETFKSAGMAQLYCDYSDAGGCACGFTSVAVLPNGDVYPCRRLPIKAGNLLSESYEDIFLGTEIMRKLRRISYYEDCKNCDYAKVCRGCPALTYSTSGDPFVKMPYCNEKVETDIGITEPQITCSYEEEWEYVANTFITRCGEKPDCNSAALRYQIYRYFLETDKEST